MTAKTIISVDGNIGCGKSTLLNHLSELGYCVFEEDLSSWGYWLDKFYEDPARWAFHLQIAILNNMRDQYEAISRLPHEVVFVERSPISNLIFSRNSLRLGFLSQEEYDLIERLHSKLSWKPNVIYVINADVDTCYKRMNQRDRPCERNVTKEYLKFLHEQYSALRAEQSTKLLTIKTVTELAKEVTDNLTG